MHLVIGIIDKGLDLAFLLDPDGDRDLIAQTIVAAIAYLERYAADTVTTAMNVATRWRSTSAPPRARRR